MKFLNFNLNHRPTTQEAYSPPHQHPTVSLDTLRYGSSVDLLTIAWGVEQSKYVPLGYDKAKEFVLETARNTRPGYAAWLLAEAEAKGRTTEAEKQFPSARKLSNLFVNMQLINHADDVKRVEEHLDSLPEYVPPINYEQPKRKFHGRRFGLRNAIGASAIGLVAGYGAKQIFDTYETPSKKTFTLALIGGLALGAAIKNRSRLLAAARRT